MVGARATQQAEWIAAMAKRGFPDAGNGKIDRTGKIWGGVVQYGLFGDGFRPSRAMPWRAAANESTTITISHDVKVEGKDLKADTYALFLDVEQSGPSVWVFPITP